MTKTKKVKAWAIIPTGKNGIGNDCGWLLVGYSKREMKRRSDEYLSLRGHVIPITITYVPPKKNHHE